MYLHDNYMNQYDFPHDAAHILCDTKPAHERASIKHGKNEIIEIKNDFKKGAWGSVIKPLWSF